MNKSIKRRLTRCVIFLTAIILTMSVSGIVRSFIWAETTAIRIDTNAEYFSGSTDMRNVEITQASSHVLLYIADSILIAFAGLLIFLFAYNGGFAVYEYFKVKEKKNEEG